MYDINKFREKRKLQEPAENSKIAVVIILVISVAIFTILGKDIVKQIVWYWAGGMSALVVLCAIQDFVISRKIKQL